MYDDDKIPDIMVKYNYGDRFPVYQYQRTEILSGKNGSSIATLSTDTLTTLSSPLSLGMTGSGNDMFLHWTSNCKGRPGQQILYKFRDDSHVHEQSRADLCKALFDSTTVARLVAVSRQVSYFELELSDKFMGIIHFYIDLQRQT